MIRSWTSQRAVKTWKFAGDPLRDWTLTPQSWSEMRWEHVGVIEGSLEVKLPTIWTDEKQSKEEAERRERLEERRVEEKESKERRRRCAKR